MLANAHVSTRLPAKDLERARTFYSEKLGLEPVEEVVQDSERTCSARSTGAMSVCS
jgi:catechol 2,3-dioxygenase-like lactoylglutathione lyase family enzyme